jgi:PPM family protein phosphatase
MTPIVHPSELRIRTAACTGIGRRRNNEDAFLADPALGLCAVADGMGGHAAGEVASWMAIEALSAAVASAPDAGFLRDSSFPNRQLLLGFLEQTIAQINASIYTRAQEQAECRGMGCTLDVALVRGRNVFLSHVGDSRIYALRGDALYTLTDDHTLEQLLLARGSLTAEEIAAHPQRNVLTRAVGSAPDVQVDLAFYDLTQGDVFALCTDGLHGVVPLEQTRDLLAKDPLRAPEALVQAALERGGRDNVTVVVFVVEESTFAEPAIIGSEHTRAALARSPLFTTFTPGELLRVQRIALAHELPAGTLVLQQDKPSNGLYLVLDGHLSVWHEGGKTGVIEPGDPFGETALVDIDSSVSIRAESPVLLLQFPKAELKGLLVSDTTIAAKLAFSVMERYFSRIRQLEAALVRSRDAALRSRGPT